MMLLISASPNSDGLTAACVRAAQEGCTQAGVAARHLNLCHLRIERCQQCENGWGDCRRAHRCSHDDDLAVLQEAIGQARGIVFVTPVYYGDLAESAKCAFDRLRRCEAPRGEASALHGLPLIAVAAAGGSGGGIASCLAQMERTAQHMRARIADLIGITQYNRPYTLAHITAATQALACHLMTTAA